MEKESIRKTFPEKENCPLYYMVNQTSVDTIEEIINHPNFVKRNHWGGYLDLFRTETSVIKYLYFKPGGRLSLQRHKHRRENWNIILGDIWYAVHRQITLAMNAWRGNNRLIKLGSPGDSFLVKPDYWHFAFTENMPALIIENQFGSLCSESDIERLLI